MKKTFISLLVTVTLFSCEEDKVYKVDAELQPIVNAFFAEAELRGKKIPKDNLIAEIRDDIATAIDSKTDAHGQKFLYVSEATFISNSRPDQIERMIFWKMGGIVLGRPNKDGYSIMNSSHWFSGYLDRDGEICAECRTELLDELFN
jgi:hypothetical protein